MGRGTYEHPHFNLEFAVPETQRQGLCELNHFNKLYLESRRLQLLVAAGLQQSVVNDLLLRLLTLQVLPLDLLLPGEHGKEVRVEVETGQLLVKLVWGRWCALTLTLDLLTLVLTLDLLTLVLTLDLLTLVLSTQIQERLLLLVRRWSSLDW